MEDKVIFTLRLPPALHEKLKEYAQSEHRSLHAQILKFLEEGIHVHTVIRQESDITDGTHADKKSFLSKWEKVIKGIEL